MFLLFDLWTSRFPGLSSRIPSLLHVQPLFVELIQSCDFKYHLCLWLPNLYYHLSPLSWISTLLYSNHILSVSPWTSVVCFAHIWPKWNSWCPRQTLRLHQLTSLKPSRSLSWWNLHPFSCSGKTHVHQTPLLFPVILIQYTLGNPGGSIFKIKFRAQAAFHHFHRGSFGPSTDIANLCYSSRFLTGLFVPHPPLLPCRLFTPEQAEWSF